MAQVTIDAGDTRFHISLAPAMPVVELTANGEDGRALPGASCTWTFVLDYPGFITVPQGFRRNGRAYRHPPIAAVTGNPVRVPFAIVTGGRLTATVLNLWHLFCRLQSGSPGKAPKWPGLLLRILFLGLKLLPFLKCGKDWAEV